MEIPGGTVSCKGCAELTNQSVSTGQTSSERLIFSGFQRVCRCEHRWLDPANKRRGAELIPVLERHTAYSRCRPSTRLLRLARHELPARGHGAERSDEAIAFMCNTKPRVPFRFFPSLHAGVRLVYHSASASANFGPRSKSGSEVARCLRRSSVAALSISKRPGSSTTP